MLADLAQLHFPVQPRPGVPIIIRDTVYHLDVDTTYLDSIRIITLETIKEVTNNIHTTDTVPDYAQVESLMQSKFEIERLLYYSDAKLEEEKERSKNRRWWAIGLGAGFAIILLLNIYTFLKPKINVRP